MAEKIKVEKEDARWRRSRAQLESAVLLLAAERDITNSSVLELTRMAGVNRSTFYAHAESPVDLLVAILARELKQILEEGFVDIETQGHHNAESSDRVVLAICDHVEAHQKIYGRTDHKSSRYALRSVLFPLMQQGVLNLFNAHLVDIPSGRNADKKAYAAFITSGVLGAIESWVEDGSRPRDRKRLLEVINNSYPVWFLRA